MSYEEAFNGRMFHGASSLLLSIEASRPAFMMVSGLFLLVIAWRLVHGKGGWSSRLILSGSLLLAFGYSVLVPLYHAGILESFRPGRHIHGDPTVVLGWHVVKLFAMNAGWFLFGLGLALHARVFAVRPASTTPNEATVPSVPGPIRPVPDSHSNELPA
jgi:hypothetical protein